jgi:fumarylacetoacetase
VGRVSWPDVPTGSGFGIANLPYGVFSEGGAAPRVGVRYGQAVIDLATLLDDDVFARPSLNAFMEQGRERWREARAALVALLGDEHARRSIEQAARPLGAVRLHLPFEVGDYVDFYASEQHATNVGRIFRPDQEPLTPNWKHLPIGYHGRSGTVVVSGTDIVRPCGQRRGESGATANPIFGPTQRLDIEAEVGYVVGVGAGEPISVTQFEQHVFGVCLVNDWSARDIQAWEYVPLGPFLGKSFATSVSPWVVPLDALSAAWVEPPPRDVPVLPYLDGGRGLDIALEIRLNGTVVSRPPYAGMYWTPAQMLAHMTVNGAATRTGDLFASGTVSGAEPDQFGSLLELNWGKEFLDDGDEVTISASAPAPDGGRIGFGEVSGRVLPARC